MTANTCEVKAVLKAITKKMDKEAMDYTGQHIAMSLYGLQWMTASRFFFLILLCFLFFALKLVPLPLDYLFGLTTFSSIL